MMKFCIFLTEICEILATKRILLVYNTVSIFRVENIGKFIINFLFTLALYNLTTNYCYLSVSTCIL